jgi:sortilin (neurotensin receptor 3)
MIRGIVRLAAFLLFTSVAAPLSAQLTQDVSEDLMKEMRWRSIGPANMGGRVSDVEGIPSPSKTFYVAAAGSGVWKTTNNGITFKSIFNSERVVATGDLAIDPNDTDVIWVGTGEEDSRNSISAGGGIYKSTDGGDTWELKGLEETEVIARIVVDPIDGNTVYVAALGHIWGKNDERGLYRTKDGGESWELVKRISDRAGFVDVVMHPQNPNVLFAASWERVRGPYFLQSGGPGSGLWKTTDGGDNWEEIKGNGFPTAEKGRIGLAISMSSPDIMYAMVEAEKEEDGSGGNGLYRSEDGGMTWEKRSDINSRPFYYSQVRVDPQDPDRIYFSSTPVQVSSDGGETVGTTTNDVHVDHHAMWIDPNDPDRIIVGNDGGVAITWDKGGNWRYLNQMAMGQPYHVSYNMDYPYRVCGGLQDNGTWCAPSRVSGQITSYHWATISGGDGFVTAQDPEDADIVFAESQGGNMSRINLRTGARTSLRKPSAGAEILALKDSIAVHTSEDGEANEGKADQIKAWETQVADLEEKFNLRWNWNTPFFISPHDRFTFYTAANRVMRSTERGDNLEIISPDLTYADEEKIRISTKTTGGITPDVTGAETFATIVSLAESPLMKGLLYAGTDDGRVWISRNGGGHWSEVTDNFPGVAEGAYVSRIEPSHHEVDRFYVTFDDHRRNNFTPYVYVTDDGGEHFRSISSDLPTGKVDFAHVVREDPHNPNLLFVGTDVGAYVSTDRGGHWQRFMEGLPTVPVHDLQIHPREREIIAATHGRSFWIANVQPLEELTDVTMADAAVLFPPTHMGMWGMEARGGESMAQGNFQRPTPNMGGSISYYLAEDLPRPEPVGGGEAEEGDEAADTAAAADAAPAAAADAGHGAPARGGPGRRGRNAGPQVKISISNASGQVVRTLQGPGRAGLQTVSWNFRADGAPSAGPTGKSPSQLRDSIKVARRAVVLIDSLVAAGEDQEEVSRIVNALATGNTAALGFGGRGGFGRGGRGSDPEAFQERPGESFGGGRGGRPNFGKIRSYVDLLYPGEGGGFGRIFRRGGGGGAPAALVDPGAYTVTIDVNGQEYSQTMRVQRMSSYGGGGGFGFEEDAGSSWEAFLEWLREGGD